MKKLRRFRSAMLMSALVSVPLVAGGCRKGQDSGTGGSGTNVVSRSGPGQSSLRGTPRARKTGRTIMGGGSLGGENAGGSSAGGNSLRGPQTGR